MKSLRKIIAFFLLIFIAGIIITAVSVNSSLNKKTPQTTKIKKDSLLFIQAEKKSV